MEGGGVRRGLKPMEREIICDGDDDLLAFISILFQGVAALPLRSIKLDILQCLKLS